MLSQTPVTGGTVGSLQKKGARRPSVPGVALRQAMQTHNVRRLPMREASQNVGLHEKCRRFPQGDVVVQAVFKFLVSCSGSVSSLRDLIRSLSPVRRWRCALPHRPPTIGYPAPTVTVPDRFGNPTSPNGVVSWRYRPRPRCHGPGSPTGAHGGHVRPWGQSTGPTVPRSGVHIRPPYGV